MAPQTDWMFVARTVQDECPSPTLRDQAVRLLTLVAELGSVRPARDEFIRVYKSLCWNETAHLYRAAQAIRLSARKRGRVARYDAWGYVMGAHDAWITNARVYYLVVGVLESALRVRVHARLTDHFGSTDWPNIASAVPSGLLKRLVRYTSGIPGAARLPHGDEFLRTFTTLSDLVMWFEGRRFWNAPVNMRDIFRGIGGTDAVPPFDLVRAVIRRLQSTRNDMAHYRPGLDLSFAEPLFAAASLSAWLGADLQHIYGAIDSRSTTELSALLSAISPEDPGLTSIHGRPRCSVPGCTVPRPPLAWILDRAPRDREELRRLPVNHACLYHRVQLRHAVHRPRRRGSPLP